MSGTEIPTQPDTPTLAEQLDVLADRLVVVSRNHPQVRDAGSLLGAVDRIIAAVVQVLMSTTSSGLVVAEGMTSASWLRAVAGRSGADAGMLLAAAERLADMPAVLAWFAEGTLSWSTVRGIVAATRNLTIEQRRWVDATLAADPGRIARLDADQAIAAVTRLADKARPELHCERAQRSFDRQFLALQPAFDGTGQMYAEMDAETTAIALQALTDLTIDDPHSDPVHHGSEAQPARSTAGQGRSSLEAFKTLCQLRLNHKINRHHNDNRDGDHDAPNSHAEDGPDGHSDDSFDGDGRDGNSDDSFDGDGRDGNSDDGDDGGDDSSQGGRGDIVLWRAAPSTARPSMLVITDLALLTGIPDGVGSATAQLLWRTDRTPVELTAEAAQRLACDATLRHVLVDGAQVLGVGATEPKVSAKLRAALEVRDGGCRFPACRQPTAVCDNHHIKRRAHGGPTALANLALLCMAHHHAVHEGRWHAILHPDASMTFTRRGVTLTSLPRADQHFRPTRPPPRGRPRKAATTEDREPPPPTPANPTVDLPF